jgi:hypothetical protein
VSFGNGIVSSLKVVFDVEDGQLARGLSESEAKAHRAATSMEGSFGKLTNQQIKSKLAQDQLNRAVDRYGPSSTQAARATLKLRDSQQVATKATVEHGNAMGKLREHAIGLGVALLGASGLVAGIKSLAEEGMAVQVVQARLDTQMRALGLSMTDYKGTIDTAIASQSRLSAFSERDLTSSFTTLLRSTKDVNQALVQNALAADVARGKNVDMATATLVVIKASDGNIGALKRMGIVVAGVTKGMSDQQKAVLALNTLHARFAGQAEAYGNTSKGAFDRFRNSVELLKEKIGVALLPALTGLANHVSVYIDRLTHSGKLQRDMNTAIDVTKQVITGVINVGRVLIGVVKGISDMFGGWRTAAEFLLAGLMARKVLSLASAFSGTGGLTGSLFAATKGVSGKGGLLRSLAMIPSVISVAVIVSAMVPKSIKTLGQDTLDSAGIGFLGKLPIVGSSIEAATGAGRKLGEKIGIKTIDTGGFESGTPEHAAYMAGLQGSAPPAGVLGNGQGQVLAAYTAGRRHAGTTNVATTTTMSGAHDFSAPAAVDYSSTPLAPAADVSSRGGGGGGSKKKGSKGASATATAAKAAAAAAYGIDSATKMWDGLMAKLDAAQKRQDAAATTVARGIIATLRGDVKLATQTANLVAAQEAKAAAQQAKVVAAAARADKVATGKSAIIPGVAGALTAFSNLGSGKNYTAQNVPGIGKILVPLAPTVKAWQTIQGNLSAKLKAALQRQGALSSSLRKARRAKFPNKGHIANLQAALKTLGGTILALRQDIGDCITEIANLNKVAADQAQKKADESEKAADQAEQAANHAAEQAQQAADQAMQSAESGAATLPADIRLAIAQADGTVNDTSDDLTALGRAESYLQGELNSGTVTTASGTYALTTEARVQITDQLNQVRAQIAQLNQAKAQLAQITAPAANTGSGSVAATIASATVNDGLAFLTQLRDLRGFQSNGLPSELRGSTITVINNFAQSPSDPGTFVDSLQFELRSLVA